MYHFWDPILRPILEAAEPKCVVEIGVDTGRLTEKLVAYGAESGAIVHAIDPHPRIDIASWRARHGQTFVFHRALSLDVLGDLRDADAVFIDGDHNWFTVYHELKLVEETRADEKKPPPLIAVHDIDWPYGRRDMYYDPSTVPEEYRQPYRRTGMVPGEARLGGGGVNAEFCNAISEGAPRNGVRTALEDFIRDSKTEWSQTFIPGFHGLAVVVPTQRLEANEGLRQAVETLHSSEFLDRWARELEIARIQAAVDADLRVSEERDRYAGELRSLDDRLQEFDRLQHQLIDAEQRLAGVADLEARINELERQLRDANRAVEAAKGRISELDDRLTASQRWLRDVQASPSWRLTAPLRRAKHLLNGH